VGSVLLKRQDVFGDVVNMASRLTSIAKARQIIISREVLEQLSSRERHRCRWYDELRVRGCDNHFSIYQVRWEPDLETVANTIPGDLARNARRVLLRSGDRSWEITPEQGLITLGRDAGCSIVMQGERISRIHAKMEFRRNKLMFCDISTNGSYVQEASAFEDIYVRREEMLLMKQGILSLGIPLDLKRAENNLSYQIR